MSRDAIPRIHPLMNPISGFWFGPDWKIVANLRDPDREWQTFRDMLLRSATFWGLAFARMRVTRA
jgi:hypothetical protein